MSSLLFNTSIVCIILGAWLALASWVFGVRSFLKREGRPYQKSIYIRSGGGGMIQDLIEVLDHCRGRRPLPASFWCFMFGFSLMLLSFLAALVISLLTSHKPMP